MPFFGLRLQRLRHQPLRSVRPLSLNRDRPDRAMHLPITSRPSTIPARAGRRLDGQEGATVDAGAGAVGSPCVDRHLLRTRRETPDPRRHRRPEGPESTTDGSVRIDPDRLDRV